MRRRSARYSFLAKMVFVVPLIAATDALFHDEVGSWLGGLMLAWTVVLMIARPALRRGPALVAGGAASALALVTAGSPGLLAWAMFWVAISIAALLPRADGFDDAWRWAVRVAAHGVTGPITPVIDLLRLFRPRPHRGRMTARAVAAMLALPIAMGAVFVALFASANPLIAHAFAAIRLPSIGEVAFWLAMLALLWPAFRPSRWPTRIVTALPDAEVTLPGASMPSVLIALGLFNAIFAVENGLDIAFLWSGAALPAGTTMAGYAHQGAYPLIVTAILAGVFVLATLKPGSATASNPTIRRLVTLWVGQNILLVASSILRTCDYIQAFSLTELRVAALIWMGLVALGLALILWRMLTAQSARWLINANALAATVVLAVSTVVDWGAVAAIWNVRHAREVVSTEPALDLCYLDRLGPSALPALLELEQHPLPQSLKDRVVRVRQDVMIGSWSYEDGGIVGSQANWRSWTWRNARRLQQAKALLGVQAIQSPRKPANLATWSCDGNITLAAPPPPAPLTKAAKP
jgi:hypothetical protein